MMLPPGPPCQDDLPHPLAGRHRVPPLLPGHPHQPRTTLRRLRRQDPAECAFGLSLTVGRVVRFYSPLALTSFLSFFINPLTTFFLARGRMPLESLAILPVIVGLAFVFRTAGIAMQEVVIALVGDAGENRRVLRRFTLRVGAASTAGQAAVVFTPLAGAWYGQVSGLSPELTAFSIVPGMLLVLLPFIEAVLSYQRGVLVKAHRTTPISVAVSVQLGVTTLVFAIMVLVLKTAGALPIGPALTAGYAAGVVVLAARSCIIHPTA